ncbi:substrate-binding and VWA domain-containing protein [Actinocorallia sp. B10E7]|uniref:substrate-binding and VWA domain-containing protein n=1 Tax=Actinocorallia sp. B10E7 TaxID=3153558 RepID=UPI00325EE9FB
MTRPPGDLPGEGGYGSSSEYPSADSSDWFSPRAAGGSSAGNPGLPADRTVNDSNGQPEWFASRASGSSFGSGGFTGASDPGGPSYSQNPAASEPYLSAPVPPSGSSSANSSTSSYDRPFPTGPGQSSSGNRGGGSGVYSSGDYAFNSGAYGTRKKRKKGALIGPLAGAVGLALLLGVAIYAFTQKSGGGCSGSSTTLTVAVAKDIAPAVTKSAEAFDGKEIDGACYTAKIVGTDPGAVRTVLTGEGVSAGQTTKPDVWIPDSSLWSNLVQATHEKAITPTKVSIASTPVVVAVPQTLAMYLQKNGFAENPSWDNLLKAAGGLEGGAVTKNQLIDPKLLNMRVPDPVNTGAGMSSISMLRTLLQSDKYADTIFTGIAQTIRNHTVPSVDSLYQNFHQDSRKRFPLLIAPEQSVYAHNTGNPKEKAVTIYPSEGMVSLDYPVTVTTEDKAKAKAAQELANTLSSPDAVKNYQALGFRSPDRKAPATFTQSMGLSAQRIKVLPLSTPEEIYKITQDWSKLSLAIRMLSVVDISGTMAQPITPGGPSRMQTILTIASKGLTQFPPDSQIGTWVFSDRLVGDQDWKEVVPVEQLNKRFGSANHLRRIQQGLLGIKAIPTGNTGLYDTVLASYQHMKKTHQPGRINSIVLFTDGLGNDDPNGGITLNQLLTQLKNEVDKRKPIQVIMVSIGSGPGQLKTMKRITNLTGGEAYIPRTPEEITQIFLKALSRRMCAGQEGTTC